MVTISQFATAYEHSTMKNIADLDIVKTDLEIKDETRQDSEGKEYNVKFLTIDNVEYRVPPSVLDQLKAVLESKPALKTFQVRKTGEGMATKYQVIPID
jgi:hypothetical protein|tara:strand:+ start:763 stop:1059 length:297 start_codon:yes stop_codon:yes gene_type:complete